MSPVNGYLHLGFVYAPQQHQTILAECDQRPPLKVVRAFPITDGGSLVHLHNVSGGVIGGDQLEIDVTLGPQTYAQLTTTSATRLYRSRNTGASARQRTTVRVGEGALLEYLPDPLIPFAGSRYTQETHIALDNDAGLFWWEMVAPGREAKGEVFAYDALHLALEINVGGVPIALERAHIEPATHALSAIARLGPYRYFASFYACRAGVSGERWLALEHELNALAGTMNQPGTVLWGASALPAHGLVVRALSCTGRAIITGQVAFWQAARRALYGSEGTLPRKVY